MKEEEEEEEATTTIRSDYPHVIKLKLEKKLMRVPTSKIWSRPQRFQDIESMYVFTSFLSAFFFVFLFFFSFSSLLIKSNS